jgi:hypothetical protein
MVSGHDQLAYSKSSRACRSRTILAIVHDLALALRAVGTWEVHGGRHLARRNWLPSDEALQPTQYRYEPNYSRDVQGRWTRDPLQLRWTRLGLDEGEVRPRVRAAVRPPTIARGDEPEHVHVEFGVVEAECVGDVSGCGSSGSEGIEDPGEHLGDLLAEWSLH